MGWLGLDDTDSLSGGCTTLEFHKLLESLEGCKIANVSLVRLWPLARRRTRGNAALACEVICDDEQELLRFLDAYWQEKIAPLAGSVTRSEHDDREQYPSDPGMVWCSTKPDSQLYYSAVRGQVEWNDLATKSWGGEGRIGALAACAWPGESHTWEGIAYREGLGQRNVCDATLLAIDDEGSTFMSRDPRQSRSLISPRGDCPVLFGIRSQSYDSALSAVERLVSAEQTQPVIAYRVFKTNQASDDHLDRIHKGVVKEIEILKRGHVNITLRDGSTLMAFKESGEVNKIAQQLIFGDVIHFLGLQVEPGVWHCEKIRASNLATRNRRRPKCECGQTYKSQGRNQPLRCPSCKSTTEATWIGDQHGGVDQSWKQAPADSRRHLSRPLEFGWAEHFEI